MAPSQASPRASAHAIEQKLQTVKPANAASAHRAGGDSCRYDPGRTQTASAASTSSAPGYHAPGA